MDFMRLGDYFPIKIFKNGARAYNKATGHVYDPVTIKKIYRGAKWWRKKKMTRIKKSLPGKR